MTKIAFFVEGKTERIFIEKFLDSYYTHPFFNVESYELRGGLAKIVTKSNYEDNTISYQFLIFDVGGDGRVASEIYERYDHLFNRKGFKHILGIRDLFPNTIEQMESIKFTFNKIFNNDEILQNISLIIAIMEIETWFLADFSFFRKVDPRLAPATISDRLNIDIETDNIERYRHPSKIVDRIYQIVDKRYKKRESDSYSICSHLDFDDLYLNQDKRDRISSFDSFIKKMDEL